MEYNLTFPLPEGWISEEERYEEVEGATITHISCHHPDSQGNADVAIELYIGDMPEDTSAEDEAFANYADMVGWSDDDDDECPIACWQFQNRKAFGFSGESEEGMLMLFMSCEIRKGALLIVCTMAKDEAALSEWSKYVEMKLRLKK